MREERNGFVLLIVIWVLALLTVITISFARRAMLDNRIAAYSVDRTQAVYMARGAVQRGMVEIRNKAFVDQLQGRAGRTSFDQRWNNPADMVNDETYYQLGGEEEIENEKVQYLIEDAERYIDVNSAPEELLDNLPDISFRVVNDIIERRNEIKGKRARAFTVKEEIRNLENISEDDWHGDDDEPGFKDLITVWGDGRININTCSEEVLQTVPDLSEDTAEQIIVYRAGPDREVNTDDDNSIPDIRELGEELDLQPQQISVLSEYCKVDSSFYIITGIATQRQGRVRATVTATVALQGSGTEVLDWREEIVGL